MSRLWPALIVTGLAAITGGCAIAPALFPVSTHHVVVAPDRDLPAVIRSIEAHGGRQVQVLAHVGAVTYSGKAVPSSALPSGSLGWRDRPRQMLSRPRMAGTLDLSAPSIPRRGPEGEPLGGYQWSLDSARIREAWRRMPAPGEGVKVAVLDTGIDVDNPDLADRIDLRSARSFVGSPEDWLDRNGHGTHVSGIVAARRDGYGIVGVAPYSRIVPLKVLDDEGWGTDSAVLEGLEWALTSGARVINLSLSGLHDRDGEAFTLRAAYARAIGRLHDRGVVVVMASGNEGLELTSGSPLVLPAQAGEGLVVGATGPVEGHHPESFAPYTNHGAGLLDLAGPGGGLRVAPDGAWRVQSADLVLSTWSTHALSRTEQGVPFEAAEHRYMGGTSMACAHVSGVAALLRAAYPEIDARWLERAILAGARPRGPRERFGSGILDAARALAALESASGAIPGDAR